MESVSLVFDVCSYMFDKHLLNKMMVRGGAKFVGKLYEIFLCIYKLLKPLES